MKTTKKIITAQVALSLLVGPIAFSSPALVKGLDQAETSALTVAKASSLQKVAEDAQGNLHWQVTLQKPATAANSQLALRVTVNQGQVLQVVAPTSGKEYVADDASKYILTESSQQEQQVVVEILTSSEAAITDYQLQVTPMMITANGVEPLADQPALYAYTLQKAGTTDSSTAADPTDSEKDSTTTVPATESSETPTSEQTTSSQPVSQPRASSGLGTGNPNVPKGAIKLDEMFEPVGWDRNAGAQISDFTGIIAPGSSEENNGMPYDEITLAGSQRAIGVWSKEKYRLDFDEDFHGRAYVNFGPADLNGDGKIDMKDSADGFAFVMQNDEKKDQALTTANESSDGQNLGVYGGTKAYKTSLLGSLITPEEHAIKNSVAVEFDLFANTSGAAIYDDQDNARTVPHMAWSLPGDLDFSYRSDHLWNDEKWDSGDKAKIYHKDIEYLNDLVGDNVRDGTWYEFRFDFLKTTQTFSYYLVNPITGSRTPTVTIDWQTLNSAKGLDLSHHDNKAYWGFTAANGAASGQTKFVFTQVPVDLDATLHNDVLSEGHSVVDRDNVENYAPGMPAAIYGQQVTFTSDFVLQADAEAGYAIDTWHSRIDPTVYDVAQGITNVKAVLNGQETLGSGTVDANGNVTVTFKEPIKVLKPTTPEAETLQLSFQAQLKPAGTITKTSFESQVAGSEIGNQTSSSFRGEDANYWVIPTPQNPTLLSWRDPTIETTKSSSKDRSQVVTGYTDLFYWQDLDQGDRLRFYLKKGDQTVFTSPVVTSKGATGFTAHEFTIPSEVISYGENDFVVEAYRQTEAGEIKEAASLNLHLTVTGSLVFKTYPENLSWTGRQVGASKGVLDRDAGNGMVLSVLDSREQGADWQLYLQAQQTTADLLPFDFVFKETAGATVKRITSEKLLVMEKNDVTPQDFYFTKAWDETTGVLLASNDYLHVGKDEYSGKVQLSWTLSNTAEIQ